MTASQRRYLMNYHWVWGLDNPDLDKTARLVMKLERAQQEQLEPLLESWLGGLSKDTRPNHWFSGGWAVDVVSHERGSAELVFSSGGQDVADSLQDGVDTFFDQVLDPLRTATVSWTELPLE